MSMNSARISDNRQKLDRQMLELANFLGLIVGAGVGGAEERGTWKLDDLSEEAKRNVGSIDDVIRSKDLSLLLRVILDAWEVAFKDVLVNRGISYQLVDKVRRIRDDFPHNLQDFSNDNYVAESLKAIEDLTSAMRSMLPSDRQPSGGTTEPIGAQTDAVSFYNQGVTFFNRRQWDLAIANFTSAIKQNSSYADAWHRRGEVQFTLRQYRQAIDDYSRAIEIDANRAVFWFHRGWAYHNLALYNPPMDFKYEHGLRKDFIDQQRVNSLHNQAVSDIDNALVLDPNDKIIWYNRGWLFLNLGNYSQTIEDCNRSLALDSDQPGTWNNRGAAYLGLRKWREAIQDFDRCLSLDPNHQTAINNKITTRNRRMWRRVRAGGGIGISVAIILAIAIAAI